MLLHQSALNMLQCPHCGALLNHCETVCQDSFDRCIYHHYIDCCYCNIKAETQSAIWYDEILVAHDLLQKLRIQKGESL